ncbi:MAG: hypothetical protein H7227_08560 [Actinobacteria bacterium]|nr:hypothetical protein [Actinomycetota bacterium]
MNASLTKIIYSLPGFSRNGDSYGAVCLISAVYFLGIAPLDPDMHHDGVQYAAAVGVSEGLNIHSQVFEQYGPITAWFQALTLNVFGSNLLTLRIENAVLLTLISLLTLKLLLVLRIPNFVSTLICAALILSCPVTSIPRISYGYAFWPWPSTISTLLLLIISLILIRANLQLRQVQNWEVYLVGILCSVLLFTRIQVGILATLTSALLVHMDFHRLRARGRYQPLLKFAASFGALTAFFVILLVLQGSLSAFFGQVIFGSLSNYGNPFAWNFYRDYYLLGSLPFLSLLGLSLLARKYLQGYQRVLAQLSVGALLFGGLYSSNVASYAFTWSTTKISFTFHQLPVTYLYASAVTAFVFLVTAAFLAGYMIIRGATRKLPSYFAISPPGVNKVVARLRKTRVHVISRARIQFYFLMAICLIPFIAQLYPMADQIHLWWISPFFSVLLVVLLSDLIGRGNLKLLMSPLLIPIILVSTNSFLDFKAIPRTAVSIQSNTFNGMEVQYRYLPSYAAVDSLLGNVQQESAIIDCPDGLFAAWNGKYLSIDGKYVNWAWATNSELSNGSPTRMFICASPVNARLFAESRGFELIEPGVNYEFGVYSSGTMFEYRIPSK